MDTKLKNYKYSAWFKLLALTLCVSGMLTLAYGLLQAPDFEDAFEKNDFKSSITGQGILFNNYNIINTLAFTYKNEANIKSGLCLNEYEIEENENNLNEQRNNDIQQVNQIYLSDIDQLQFISDNPDPAIEPDTGSQANPVAAAKSKEIEERIKLLKQQKEQKIKEINDKYDKLLAEIGPNLIKNKLSEFYNLKTQLNKSEGIEYSVFTKGSLVLSNANTVSDIKSYFESLPFYVHLTPTNLHAHSSWTYLSEMPENSEVFIGMTSAKYNSEKAAFEKASENGFNGLVTSSLGLLLFLIGLVYLIYSAGRRPDKEGVYLLTVDVAYLDIALAVTIGGIGLCIAPIIEFLPQFFRHTIQFNESLVFTFFGVIIAIGTLIGCLFVTMLFKRIKRKEALKHTLIYKLCSWLINKVLGFFKRLSANVSGVFDKSPLVMRLIMFFVAYAFIIIIFVAMLVKARTAFVGFLGLVGVNLATGYYLLKNSKAFIDIRNGAERIKAGDLGYTLPEQGLVEFRQLSATINQIADGLKNAVGSQVKAERLKAELITNVSHDLKTPLTSIITYVDLLKNEGLKSENAEKYLEVIDTKSQRLKSLTEDLFEAAKATSGNITVNLDNLNVSSLISQGLGELSDKIEASGLIFKTSLPADNVSVNADGKLLWRVIENLLSNVFKYAQPNSRVYIDVTKDNSKVSIIIKNISAYELNINADELMERFKRGDASRHSEGSGLGLSIAKSLTEIQGGSFSISVDGDLFKAVVELNGVE